MIEAVARMTLGGTSKGSAMGVALLREAHGLDTAGPMPLLFRLRGSDHSNARNVRCGERRRRNTDPGEAIPLRYRTARAVPLWWAGLLVTPDGSRRAAFVDFAQGPFSRSSDASSNG